jgi:aspartyl-tRNA(Asn)/glutamyl-tRNA(Gln) amidotransferase subunit B
MVVGLEVHCQLGTRSKLFCSCANDGFGTAPNSRTCPVCTGQPGVLPVLNKKAVELAFQAGLALGAKLAEDSIFARKNYFYPDLPKAYQISQYEKPFCEGGGLEIKLGDDAPVKFIRLERIHMEEDAGKLLHEIGSEKLEGSLVDFNRSSVPLIEIVSKPDLRSPEEAHAYLTELKQILQYIEVSACDMEKGEMRCDANVSIRLAGSEKLGTRVEIKNLNSFRGVKDALGYEFGRQIELVESGGRVVQETRLWDTANGITVTMRSKEEAHDYRYFPDPDLVALRADAALVNQLKAAMPELPAKRKARFASQYGLSTYDGEVLTREKALADYFEAAAKGVPEAAKTAANLLTTELLGRLNAEGKTIEESPVTAGMLTSLVGLTNSGIISSKGAKELFAKAWETGKDPKILVSELGLSQVSDESQIGGWVDQALAANPQAVDDIKNGKDRAIGAIVGTVMKLSKGKANPGLVNRLIMEKIKK